MNDISKEVKNLLNFANKKERYFLGRRPSEREIQNQINNFNTFETFKLSYELINNIFEKKGHLAGRRIPMGNFYNLGGKLVGYNSFIILNDAKPTKYEMDAIDMGNHLDYLFFKTLFVHSDFRGKDIGSYFIKKNLKLAKDLDKHSIVDVEKNNFHMINVLEKNNFSEDFKWDKTECQKMIRYFHE